MMEDCTTSAHGGEGSEMFGMTLGISSPFMLSPTDEASNPFFAMSTVGDLSQTFILDLGLGSPKKILLTPQDLPLFSSLHDDSLEGDYFSIDTTLTKRQRLSLHPTRQSSTSLASTTSSATPSEADSSDLIDLAAQDDDEIGAEAYQMEMLAQNKRSQVGSAEGELGLGFYMNNTSSSGMLPTSVHLHNPLEQGQQRAQVAAVSSHATMALSSFNLSDFISYDQEHTQNRHNNHHSFEARANMFATPEKPITARDMRILAMTRSSSFSSAMTSSPKTPANGGNYHDRLSALGYQEAQRHMEGTQGQYLERPKFPLRTFSTPEESLSCNPAQITPSHQRFGQDASSEDDARSQNSYFLSSPGSAFHEKLDKGRQDFSASPPSPYSSPLESHPGLWNSLPQGERERDVFDGELPLHESRPVAPSFSSPLPHTPQHHQLQLENSAHRSSPQGRGGAGGALRNARLSSLAAKRQSMSPYQSPLSDHGAFDSPPGSTTHMLIGGQTVTGIITKRSRGRRVPNNPHELNNLGKSGKVYTCKVPGCGKCFKRSEHLKRHVRSIHTNDKPFTCHCGKTFSRHDNLNQHARVHATGEEEVFGNAGSPSSTASPMSLPAAFAKTHLDGDDGAYFESE